MIGVAPVHQGNGNGSKLLRSKLAQIDKNNFPCYLHTENEKNVKYYEKFKFELIGKIKIPNSEVTLNAMLRKYKK
jgi:ribosomal protein S18 acetylase RimI-like enzyme